MIEQLLIEKALALTGRTMEDKQEVVWIALEGYSDVFSIEKFGWYLLSPEFIEKYEIYYPPSVNKGNWIAKDFGEAIYEYQKGNPEPLISLLEKIG